MAKATAENLLEFLTKQQVLLPEEAVEIPEWERTVTLRGWTARERDAFEADSLERAQKKVGSNGAAPKRGQRAQPLVADLSNFRARLLSRTIIDENGQRVFANPKGEELLGAQPAAIVDRLFTVAQRLHGMSAEDVENLTKNLEATDEGDLSSDSPSPSDVPLPN